MIDWIFFDVGNVLFNDDPQSFASYCILHEHLAGQYPEYTFEHMLAEREMLARAGHGWNLNRIARRLLGDDRAREVVAEIWRALRARYDEHHIVNDGVRELLTLLGARHRLGIVANQPPECRESLRRRGLLDFFEVVAISEELDLHKPDVKLYQWALDQAECEPERAVMIGDRLDNDVAPAAALSMATVLLQWPGCHAKSWTPDDARARAFLASCDRAPLFGVRELDPRPDFVIPSLFEAVGAIDALAESFES